MCTMHVYVNQLINSSIDLPGAQSVSPTPGSAQSVSPTPGSAQSVSPTPGSSQSSACSNVDPNHG